MTEWIRVERAVVGHYNVLPVMKFIASFFARREPKPTSALGHLAITPAQALNASIAVFLSRFGPY